MTGETGVEGLVGGGWPAAPVVANRIGLDMRNPLLRAREVSEPRMRTDAGLAPAGEAHADTRLSLKAGSFAFGPRGVPHTFYAEAGGARALVGFAPMQFEGFQREVGEPAPERVLPPPAEGHPDMARLAPIAKQHGFEILGPPGPPPGH